MRRLITYNEASIICSWGDLDLDILQAEGEVAVSGGWEAFEN